MPYARDKNAIAICDRSGQKMLRADMIEDGYLRGMMVHPEWYDGPQQQEEPFDPEEGIAIYKPRPDNVQPMPYSPVLTGSLSGSHAVLNWTQQDTPWGTLKNWYVWRQLPGMGYIRIATVNPIIPVDIFVQLPDLIGREEGTVPVVSGLTYTDTSWVTGSNYYVTGIWWGQNGGLTLSPPSNIVQVKALPVWVAQTSKLTVTDSMATDGTNLIAFGTHSGSPAVQYSPDGVNWTLATGTLPADVAFIGFGVGGLAVCTGSSAASFSTDYGHTWNTASVQPDVSSFGYSAPTYGNGTFLLVGKGESALSTDGSTWTSHALGYDDNGDGLVWDGAQWVSSFAADDGSCYVATSTDGYTWTKHLLNSDSSYLPDVLAYTGSQYLGLDTGNSILRASSTPAGLATAPNITFAFTPWYVAYGNGLTVVVGNPAGCATSPDLITWTTETLHDAGIVSSLVYAGGNSIFVSASASTAGLSIRTGS